MTDALLLVLLGMAAYLAGSVLFAPIVCRLWRLPDPRALGSGNPGATNVYRAGGWLPALVTLLLDAGKGWLPVWISAQLGQPIMAQVMIALCAVTGHMVPLFFRFQGGKGVATALGAGLALAPATTLFMAVIWLSIMGYWRISALASVTAAVFAPLISALLEPEALPLFALMALLIAVRHRSNLIRLAQGRELGFGPPRPGSNKPPKPPETPPD